MVKIDIKDFLTKHDLSLDEFASKSGVNVELISTLITDDRSPLTWDDATRLLNAMNAISVVGKTKRFLGFQSDDEEIEDQLRKASERIMRLKDLAITHRDNQELEIVPAYKRMQPIPQLYLTIDRGLTPDEEISDFLSEVSLFYRMHQGSGINFEIQGIHTLQFAAHV